MKLLNIFFYISEIGAHILEDLDEARTKTKR